MDDIMLDAVNIEGATRGVRRPPSCEMAGALNGSAPMDIEIIRLHILTPEDRDGRKREELRLRCHKKEHLAQDSQKDVRN